MLSDMLEPVAIAAAMGVELDFVSEVLLRAQEALRAPVKLVYHSFVEDLPLNEPSSDVLPTDPEPSAERVGAQDPSAEEICRFLLRPWVAAGKGGRGRIEIDGKFGVGSASCQL